MAKPNSGRAFLSNDPPPDSLSVETDTTVVPESTSTTLNDKLKTTTPPEDKGYVFPDRYGDPFNNKVSKSPFILKPQTQDLEIKLEDDLSGFTFNEKIDSLDVRPPSKMSPQDFAEFRKDQLMKEYWEKISLNKKEEERKAPNPLSKTIYKPGTTEPLVEIKPAGSINVRFGGKWQKTENPAVARSLQRTGAFDFDQQIKINLQGDIGERLKVNANWNTNASFEVDNNLKIAFQGKEEDWLRDIQAGNISVPLNTQLIKGANQLFGIKTVMQFGKVGVTSFVSSQRGKRQSITIQGGGQAREFEFAISEYDAYKHFFLGHYFRDVFEKAYEINPINPNNGFTINRVEAFITNTNVNTENLKNVVAFIDLGEENQSVIANNSLINTSGNNIPGDNPDNTSNNIYDLLAQDSTFRNTDLTTQKLEGFGFVQGVDFEKINNTRALEEGIDFTFHPELGFISLTRKLQDDEALCVAFEYTLDGRNYTVGELQNDYQSLGQDEAIVTKLIKPSKVDLTIPTWDLMMKNIYSLNTQRISKQNFQLRVIYKDDQTGLDNPSLQEGSQAKGKPLLQLLGLDKLDPNGDKISDGNFDFIEEATVLTRRGQLLFPTPEPFGDYMERTDNNLFFTEEERNLKNKYVFKNLYENTQAEARRSTTFNKFFIKGRYESATTQNIRLPGFGVTEGSVTVQSGAVNLTEGVHYTVNYSANTVNIIDAGVFESGNDIKISFEAPDLFTFRSKSLIGSRVEYNHSKNYNFGATFMKTVEQPLVQRISVGDEPLNNTQIGADISFQQDSRLLTKIVDFLPVIQTKAKSSVNGSAEVAMLLPGSSRLLEEGGASYIDDFEGAETPYDFSRSLNQWVISTPPRILGNEFSIYEDYLKDDVGIGDHRGKLSWYNPDQSFYISTGGTVDGIGDPEIQSDNLYTKGIDVTEIFKRKQPGNNINNNLINTFNLNYYPKERGPYNYNIDPNELNSDGTFRNPENNWAGITRAVTNDTDFENANIEFLEFWVLDPFSNDIYDAFPEDLNGVPTTEMGGTLYFNLGNVSEDVIKDKRHGFENGLPVNIDTTDFGIVTNETFLNDAFESNQDREEQDKGFDGLTDAEEASQDFFGSYVDALANILDPDALETFSNDPSSDNFEYYITNEDRTNGDDPNGRTIIERYKNFNGYEDNSPIGSVESSTTLPDNEDLNNNKTLDETDSYFQYSIPISTDVFNGTADHKYVNSVSSDKQYYQIRIPIRDYEKAVNNISSFNTIKYMRMYLTDFKHPVALRMINLQLISAQWRKYIGYDLDERKATLASEPQSRSTFVSTVNVEENDNYQLPPGTSRDRNQAALGNNVQLNEQSLQICTDDLRGNVGVGAFKNISTDLINYKRLKMFIHGESQDASTEDDDLDVFLRLGTDLTENYYEIAVPLKLSPMVNDPTTLSAEEIWVAENEIDLPISDLTKVKLARNTADFDTRRRFTQQIGKYKITVVGMPDRSSVRTAMLGINNTTEDDKSACVWLNELRVTEFNKAVGWAGVGNINATLADLGSISASVNYTSANWGDLETKLAERSRERNFAYGAQTNLALHKFGPEKIGIKLPLFASIDGQRITPKFDPFDPDVSFNESKNSKSDSAARRLDEIGSYTRTIKSINLTNVKKEKINPDAKKHFFDIENVTVSLSYKEEKRQGAQPNSPFGNAIDTYLDQTYRGVAGYAYNFKTKPIAPFKKLKWKSDYFKLIKDFNFTPTPNSIAFTGTLNRRYFKNQLLNSDYTINGIAANYEKSFTFDRDYTMRWNLAKSLSLNYSANANALVDEPVGDREGTEGIVSQLEYRDILWDNIKDLGRLKNFTQTATATYKLPLNKIPILSWISSDAKYKVSNSWQASAFQQSPNPLNSPIALRDTSSEVQIIDGQEVSGRILGNDMSNSVDFKLNGNFNFVKLYNKSKFLKEINTPQRKKLKVVKKLTKKEQAEKEAKETKKEGEEGEEEKEEKPKKKLSKMAGVRIPFRTLMLVRNLQLTYNQKASTELPAVLLTPRFLGGDYDDEFDGYGPGLPFLTGSQNLNVIKNEAIGNGWYSRSTTINSPIQQRNTESITAKASLEPFKDFRIKLDADYTQTDLYTEILRFNDETGQHEAISPIYSGSVKMSYITFPTAFTRDRDDNSNSVFDNFDENRKVIADKLNADDNGTGEYTRKSKDALMPAFIAAYTGKKFNNTSEINSNNLRTVPRIPLPNWRIDYAGLSRLPKLRKKFSTFSLKHAYKSTFEVRSFKTSTAFNDPESINYQTNINSLGSVNERSQNINANGAYEPLINVDEVQITERFSPLIGVNIRTRKSKVNFKLDYNKSRTLTLDNGSFRITESTTDDIVVGFGKTKKNANLTNMTFGLIKKPDGTDIILKNNLTFKTDLSVRNRKTVQRKFEEDSEESISGEESSANGGVTAGDLNFQLRPNLNYQYNKKLNVQLFFERTINVPQLSSSFVRKTFAFGVNVRFSLT